MEDRTDWSVTPDVGKHKFRGSGPITEFKKGPRGGVYVRHAGRWKRVRPYWLKPKDSA